MSTLSKSQIRVVASQLLATLAEGLACLEIPQPYKYEMETDPPTVELRQAIEKYIATMQDERLPYPEKAVIKTALSKLAQRKRPGAKGLIRNPNGRRSSQSA